ncbi:MAG TPA: hypothetical protein VK985_09410 [Rariglobus sp.]|nr:hypothetical protein [Rariglobus sp.]
MSTEIIDALRNRMECEEDILRVVNLVPYGDRFRYLIETPFKTFPRFVIGTTDAAFDDVRLELRCGLLTTAERYWNNPSDET